jgi:DNA-binding PadR family transcriptional regulator
LLKKLERQKLIKGEWEKTEHGKERWVKVYRPTDKGRETFHTGIIEVLSVPQPSPRPMMLGLSNLPAVTPAEAVGALRQYGKQLTEKMGMLRAVLESDQQSHPYFVNAMFELGLTVMQAELEWVEKFTRQIEEESQTKQE